MSNVVPIRGRWPSKAVRWVLGDGTVYERTYERAADDMAVWKILCGAVQSTALDRFGHVNAVYTLKDVADVSWARVRKCLQAFKEAS